MFSFTSTKRAPPRKMKNMVEYYMIQGRLDIKIQRTNYKKHLEIDNDEINALFQRILYLIENKLEDPSITDFFKDLYKTYKNGILPKNIYDRMRVLNNKCFSERKSSDELKNLFYLEITKLHTPKNFITYNLFETIYDRPLFEDL